MSGYSKTAWANGAAPAISADNLGKLETADEHALGVDTIAALRAMPVPTFATRAWIRGHSAVLDGGNGPFDWDASCAGADDDGITINPAGHTGAGRWVRSYTGAVNAMWYGADGNGLVDASDAIRHAAAAAQGGTLELPVGEVFLFDPSAGSITLSTAGTTIGGGGKIKVTSSTKSPIEITADECEIDGIILQGDGTFNASKTVANDDRIALVMIKGNRCAVRNCKLIDGYQNFVHFNAVYGGFADNNLIVGGPLTWDITHDTAHQGIRAYMSSDMKILNNTIAANDSGGKTAEAIYVGAGSRAGRNHSNVIAGNICKEAWDHGVYFATGSKTIIRDNVIMANGSGIVCSDEFDTALAVKYEGNQVTGNVIDAPLSLTGTVGLFMRDSNGSICDSNTVRGYPVGIQMSVIVYSHANFTMNANSIINNIISGCATSGITCGAGGRTIKEFSDNLLSGNNIKGIGSVSGYGIAISHPVDVASNNIVSNNQIENCGNVGIGAPHNKNIMIKNNMIINPSVAGAADAAGIRVNGGYNNSVNGNVIIDTNAVPTMKDGIQGTDTFSSMIKNNTIQNAASVPIRGLSGESFHNTLLGNKTGSDALAGTVTLAAGRSTVVQNNNINAQMGHTTQIVLSAITVNASSLDPSVASGDHVNGVSFMIRHSLAVGSETFFYQLIQ